MTLVVMPVTPESYTRRGVLSSVPEPFACILVTGKSTQLKKVLLKRKTLSVRQPQTSYLLGQVYIIIIGEASWRRTPIHIIFVKDFNIKIQDTL